jgi:hypothetical protein
MADNLNWVSLLACPAVTMRAVVVFGRRCHALPRMPTLLREVGMAPLELRTRWALRGRTKKGNSSTVVPWRSDFESPHE